MHKSLTFSAKILAIRDKFSMSQQDLADRIGVTKAAIGLIERGKTTSPSAEILAALATKLSISTDWLLLGDGEMLKPAPGEDAGVKKTVVSASQTQTVEHSKPVTHKGESVPTFRIKGTKPPEPVGTDLVRQVDKHTREIELMQQTLETVVAELRQLHTK